MNDIKVTAKPIEWKENGGGEWIDTDYSFSISHLPDDFPEYPYCAIWGEGDEDSFETLDEAKQWCQAVIDEWFQEHAVVTPNAKVSGAGTASAGLPG